MKYRLVDLLACPMCRHFPLELVVIEEKVYEREVKIEKPACELYCGLLRKPVKEAGETPCEECLKKEVVTGVLICSQCNRWYPIIDEIPRMLPDELRRESEDVAFLEKYKDKLPEKVLKEGRPYNLSNR